MNVESLKTATTASCALSLRGIDSQFAIQAHAYLTSNQQPKPEVGN
jgi:hypothetical protein